MKSIGGLILIVFGGLWAVAAILRFVDGLIGPGAIFLLIGAGCISLGQNLRGESAATEEVHESPDSP